jgi:hypothetical protein
MAECCETGKDDKRGEADTGAERFLSDLHNRRWILEGD